MNRRAHGGWDTYPFRALLLAGWVLLAGRADATTLVPMSLSELSRGSLGAVIATPTRRRSVEDPSGALYTLVDLDIDEVLAGPFQTGPLVLKEIGGRTVRGGHHVAATPSYVVGEPALIFLDTWPDGSLRTFQMALGKLDIELDRDGMPQARRRLSPALRILGSGLLGQPVSIPLGDLRRIVRHASPSRSSELLRLEPPEALLPSEEVPPSPRFVLVGSRFFEPDEKVPISFLVDASGDATLGLPSARAALASAFQAWTAVPDAAIHLEDGGLTDDLSTSPCTNQSKILFNDPTGAIPDPDVVPCKGILALGGTCTTSFEYKRFQQRTFQRQLRGTVVFANGWGGCDIWTAENIAEVATHELGHAIGLGHSSEKEAETNPLLVDATMYFRAHFDGRGASLREDDIAAVGSLYPNGAPLTVLTPDPLPNATYGIPYSVPLTATGGTGPYTWSLLSTPLQNFQIDSNTTLSGVPQLHGRAYFQVRVSDTAGNQHAKLLYVDVLAPPLTPTFTPTLSPTTTPTRSPSMTATHSPSATASPSRTPTRTATETPTRTETATSTPSRTPTSTPTHSHTRTATPSASQTSSRTPTPSPTPSRTATSSPTATSTPSQSPTRTLSPTRTDTPTQTPSPTSSPTHSYTPSPTPSSSPTATPSPSPTTTASPSRTATPTRTPASTRTPLPSATPTPGIEPTASMPPVRCPGDCDASGHIDAAEILSLLQATLRTETDACGATATIEAIVASTRQARQGCPR